MSVKVFLSTVSDEFRSYRERVRHEITLYYAEVKIQDDFKALGGETLDMLDVYMESCDAVVHLVGNMTGACPGERGVRTLLKKYPDLSAELPPFGEALKNGDVPYTQWEAWLALYHNKLLLIAKADDSAAREASYAPTDASRAGQAAHLERLKAVERFPSGGAFKNEDQLCLLVFQCAIFPLLVKAYAEGKYQRPDLAKGLIEEMSRNLARETGLDSEGRKEQVGRAIETYEQRIADGQVRTNISPIVDEALDQATTSLAKPGGYEEARQALRKAAEEMRRDEEERRERYVLGVTALYHRARDTALAAFDGEGAADAVEALAKAIHGDNAAMVKQSMNAEAATLHDYGRDRGSNVHLVAEIALRRNSLVAASTADERGEANNNLGNALSTLGSRESGTARLEEAVAAYRAALEQRTRERVPLDWARTQNNLGTALARLGERESGTARLEEAVAAYRAALEELTRARIPLDWATTQASLGAALQTLGERESGTARLEEAIAAYRAALEEGTRERVPLDWARTQNDLGNALATLGARERGTGHLEEALAAYHAALEEGTRERVPLDWARTQMNLGTALGRLGARENGTARLEEAVAAYRAALEEGTRERVPLDWAATQMNLGNALATLGARESGTARFEEAVAAYRAALEEWTREATPHWHDMAQRNMARCLALSKQRRRP